MDGDHKLDHLKNGFTQSVANSVDHNTDTLNAKVPSMGWVLFAVQF